MDCVIGGLAGAAGSTIITNPMDVVKTRMQLQGELRTRTDNAQSARYRGIFRSLYVIARTDGAAALQKGLALAMLLGFTMNAVKAQATLMGGYMEFGIYADAYVKSTNPHWVHLNPMIEMRLRAMPVIDFIIGGLSGAGATIFSNPMDVVKTRLQLQGQLRSREENKKTAHYRNVFHAAYVIARTEGPLALQKGLVPAMVLGLTFNGFRLGVYHVAEDRNWTKDDKGFICLYKATFCAGLAGAVGGGISNPIYIVKTRIQAASHPSIAVGRQHEYNGTMDAVSTIYKTDGIKGFYAGLKTTCVRMGMGSAAQLTTFSASKQALLKRGIGMDSPIRLAFLASLLSGIAVAIVACPLDVVAIRLYNQGSTNKLYSSGILDTIIKIYRIEGLHGVYKGIVPLYMRMAPHTTATLVIWDALYGLFYLESKKL